MVLVIGLPCEIASVMAYLLNNRIDTSNLYLCDLICHGPTSSKVADEYIQALESKFKSRIVDFSVRYKKDGWTPPYLRAVFENGREYVERFYSTDYGIAFSRYSRPSCYQCRFKGENHVADITIGDHWGLDGDSPLYNKNGVSVALVRTKKGQEMLTGLSGFHITETDTDKAVQGNRMYSKSKSYNKAQYERFSKDFAEKGLRYACFRALSFKQRIVRLLPSGVVAIAYKVLKR